MMDSPDQLLPLLVLIPLVGGLALSLLPNQTVPAMAFVWTLVTLAVSVAVAYLAYQPIGADPAVTFLSSGDLWP